MTIANLLTNARNVLPLSFLILISLVAFSNENAFHPKI
jgi:hypothetical protein